MEMKERKRGYILGVASAFFYALQVVLGKFILNAGMAAMDLLVIQYTGSTMILAVFLLLRKNKMLFRPEKKYWIPLIIQGIIGCFSTSFFFYLAMERLDAGIASVLLYLCPVYICVFFMVTGIRKISLSNNVAVVFALAGALLALDIFTGEIRYSILGIALGAISGICYAFYGVFADLKLRALKTEQMLFFMYLTATIAFWIINPGFLSQSSLVIEPKMIILIICVTFLQVLPMALLNLAIREIGSHRASVVATAELPFTILLAYAILSESFVGIQLVGILLIVAAILLLQKKEKTKSED